MRALGSCVLGANVARALFGADRPVGRSLTLAGESWYVVGVQTPRKGGFFGENRNDHVMFVPLRAAQRRFSEAEATVLYVRARPGERDARPRRDRGDPAAAAAAGSG